MRVAYVLGILGKGYARGRREIPDRKSSSNIDSIAFYHTALPRLCRECASRYGIMATSIEILRSI